MFVDSILRSEGVDASNADMEFVAVEMIPLDDANFGLIVLWDS
jgi:hypothetical protein